MRRRSARGWRILLTALLVAGAAGTALAQRGGFRSPSRSYTGNVRYDGKFVFIRMSYPSGFGRGGAAWSHDYPEGEENFMKIFTDVSNITAHVMESSIMSFGDPELFKFPVAYLCEPGYWSMSDAEALNLRAYLLKGGFLVVDDFPYWAWGNFELQMSRVMPNLHWIQLTPTDKIFHSFFEIDTFDGIFPPYSNLGGRPEFRALFEDNDRNKRMYVVANFQNDISEYWEYSGQGYQSVSDENQAYKIGINEFLYGITH